MMSDRVPAMAAPRRREFWDALREAWITVILARQFAAQERQGAESVSRQASAAALTHPRDAASSEVHHLHPVTT